MRLLALTALFAAVSGCSVTPRGEQIADGFYVVGGVDNQDVNYYEVKPTTGQVVVQSHNPIGEVGFGIAMPIAERWTFDLQLFRHRSAVTEKDHGVNFYGAQLYYFPFKAR